MTDAERRQQGIDKFNEVYCGDLPAPPEGAPDFFEDMLKQLLADHPARWMIWEEEPLAETVAQLQALGVHSAVVDPCGNAPEQGDFLDVMKKHLAALRRVYAP